MVAYTTTYNLKKPTVADDEDVWGGYLNDSMDIIDDVLDGTVPVTGIDINSGTLDNVVIGGATANSGTFTVLSATTSLGVTGNITVSGTVDGRDVSADGAKLDGIESGATADQTKADIDALGIAASTAATLETARNIALSGDVSGSASFNGSSNISITATVADDSHNHVISNVDGLQTALDGKLASSSYTASDVLTKIKTVDGSGSGLDADTVDGLQATSFLRSDTSDSWSGTLTGSGPITTSAAYIETGVGGGGVAMTINDGGGNANLTFNHRSRNPDVTGQAARIVVNVDNTTAEGTITFQTSNASVPAGTVVDLDTGLVVAHDYIEVPYRIRHQGDADTYIEFVNNTMNFRTANAHEMQITNSGVLLVNSALHEDYDALSGTSVTVDPNTGGAWSLTMTGNTTFTFGATVNNYSTGIIIELTGNGGTVTWPTSVDWAGGTAPDAPASGETDIYVFWTRDGGTTWYGVQSIDAAA